VFWPGVYLTVCSAMVPVRTFQKDRSEYRPAGTEVTDRSDKSDILICTTCFAAAL